MNKSNFKLPVLFSFVVAIIFSGCSIEEAPVLPTVSFSVKGHDRPAPAEVEFTNYSRDADSYKWSFDDGNTSTEENPTHTYEEPGNYSVTLTAKNDEGSESKSYRFTVYGEIKSWTPDRISLMENKWEDKVGTEIYVVVRHVNGDIFSYTEDGKYYVREISFVNQNPWHITLFDNNMNLSLTDGSVIFQIRQHTGGSSIDQNNDPLLFEHTLEASDIVPDNDTDPYLSEVILEEEGVVLEVEYNEAE